MAGKVGRPRKAEPREIPVGFKVSQAEYRYLQLAAVRAGCSIGELVRALALARMPAAVPVSAPSPPN